MTLPPRLGGGGGRGGGVMVFKIKNTNMRGWECPGMRTRGERSKRDARGRIE